jgi:hypothetical protein
MSPVAKEASKLSPSILICQFAKHDRANEKNHFDDCTGQQTIPTSWRNDSCDRKKNSDAKEATDY